MAKLKKVTESNITKRSVYPHGNKPVLFRRTEKTHYRIHIIHKDNGAEEEWGMERYRSGNLTDCIAVGDCELFE